MSRSSKIRSMRHLMAVGAALGALLCATAALAEPLGYAGPFSRADSIFRQVLAPPQSADELLDTADVPGRLRRQVVDYPTREAPGTIVIDTPNTYLYFVLGGGRAIRYGIGVGREGFTWSGVKAVERKAEWPDWVPPAEMLGRQPYLPRIVAGGPGNPLGARAMYIGGTVYRIHGTNDPSTIGKRVSSGCFRMTNEDVIDLYARVNVGTKVVVLPMQPRTPDLARQQPANPKPARTAAADLSRAHALY
jgi:lipoprotein-anchoring transpeptidase ErfK/SrfK